jgi:hypothetical protein
MRRRIAGWRVGALTVLALVAACGSGSKPDGAGGVDTTEATPASGTPAAGGAGGPRPAAMCVPPELLMVVAYDLDTGAYRWHECGTCDLVLWFVRDGRRRLGP